VNQALTKIDKESDVKQEGENSNNVQLF
jgi:hypothetical protein